jgi:uncharacterized membrane protein YphA (DoxX/SURF4 family)
MKYITYLSRLLVGALFIISGLIKANDAIGFSYKLEEYFAADVLNLEFLIPFALVMAAAICIVEIVLGVMVLIGSRPKLASWSLLGMIVFFTFLTFYSAYFNKVTDCGCFGDAIKLTPWGSFKKDIILLIFILVIFVKQKTIKPLLKSKMENMLLLIVAFFCFAFVYDTHNHLPKKDFRPYAIGKNITDGMKTCEELELPCPEVAYYYKVKDKSTGEEMEILSTEYIEQWEKYDFVSSTDKTVVLQEGYEPPIHDFSISIGDADYTSMVLDEDYAFLLVCYNINKTSNEHQESINKFHSASLENNIAFFALSASSDEDIQKFNLENQVNYQSYFTDETTLKTIVRSNPGLLLLKNGTVVGKWHHNDFPEFETIQNQYLN